MEYAAGDAGAAVVELGRLLGLVASHVSSSRRHGAPDVRSAIAALYRLAAWVNLAAACGAAVAYGQASIPPSAAKADQAAVQVNVDLGQKIAPFAPIYSWFGYDEANYTTTELGGELLRELHDLAPVPVHIRVHHLLTSGDGQAELKFSSTNVYHEDASGKPVYDFRLLDGIFDAYKAAGVEPMVEFGFMPKDLAAVLLDRNEPYQVHFPQSTVSGASNNPPKDYARWGELIHAVTAHLSERYGKETVQHWYFEVWNEPDIDYWHASREDYFRLYDYTVAAVRAVLPSARVGGPATTGSSGAHAEEYLKAFLDHVTTGRSAVDGGSVPLDFISFHVKGKPTVVDGKVTMGINHELSDADNGFALIARYPALRRLPIILSEADPEGCAACSSRVNPANSYRNGTLYPAYTAAAFKGLVDLARQHDVNLISMLSWSFEFEGKDYFEGFRSLATNGIDKPILNLFRMLGLMGGERVKAASSGSVPLAVQVKTGVRAGSDVDVLATHEGSGAAVLLWNYQDAADEGVDERVEVHVTGVPPGVRRLVVRHYRIDDTHSNAYTVWKEMGSPQQPTAAEYARLKAAEGLELLDSPIWLDTEDGAVRLSAVMPKLSVSLWELSW